MTDPDNEIVRLLTEVLQMSQSCVSADRKSVYLATGPPTADTTAHTGRVC